MSALYSILKPIVRKAVKEKAIMDIPMPGLMIPVSCCNLIITEESYKRMEEIEKRDIMMFACSFKVWPDYYNHDGALHPIYLAVQLQTTIQAFREQSCILAAMKFLPVVSSSL